MNGVLNVRIRVNDLVLDHELSPPTVSNDTSRSKGLGTQELDSTREHTQSPLDGQALID